MRHGLDSAKAQISLTCPSFSSCIIKITMALLWNPESWSQRLAELEAQSGDLKEAPLRRDVRSLGTLLGEVLREQAGEELFAQVEALRQGTIRRRDAEAARPRRRSRAPRRRRAGTGALAARRARHPAHPRLCLLLRAHQSGRNQPSQAPPHCPATERRRPAASAARSKAHSARCAAWASARKRPWTGCARAHCARLYRAPH